MLVVSALPELSLGELPGLRDAADRVSFGVIEGGSVVGVGAALLTIVSHLICFSNKNS